MVIQFVKFWFPTPVYGTRNKVMKIPCIQALCLLEMQNRKPDVLKTDSNERILEMHDKRFGRNIFDPVNYISLSSKLCNPRHVAGASYALFPLLP